LVTFVVLQQLRVAASERIVAAKEHCQFIITRQSDR
jgi:hypothetical protein